MSLHEREVGFTKRKNADLNESNTADSGPSKHTLSEADRRERQTFRLDSVRIALGGVATPVVRTVLLLVAIEYFALQDVGKGIIASASYVGLMASLFYAAAFASSSLKKSTLVALPTLVAGVLMVAAGFSESGMVFTLIVSLSVIFQSVRSPFMLGIYEDNYSPARRGKLYSWGLIFSLLVSVASNYLFASLLERQLELFRTILWGAGFSVVLSSLIMFRIPSKPSLRRHENNPLRNLSIIFTDRRFGLITLSWFVAGFASLLVTPLRVVYLASSPPRGLDLSPMTVLIIVGIIPNVVRLAFTRVWGYLFDRANFIVLRIAMSLILGIGNVIFFLARDVSTLAIASAITNIGFAGTLLAWNLWVTKIAPPGRSQVYMSVHSFFTGLRGITAPLAGFLYINHFNIRGIGLLSFVLILASILLLLPHIRAGRSLVRSP